jgi:flagellar biosynthetic protein FliR
MIDFIQGYIFGIILVVSRVGAFFVTAPVLSWQAIPMNLKVAMAVMLSLFFAGIQQFPESASNITTIEAVIMIAGEILIGSGIGIIIAMLFAVVEIAARIIERQMGLAISGILDPLTGQQGKPLSMLMTTIFILMFLSVNGHHAIFIIIGKSFDSFPIASGPDVALILESFAKVGGYILLLGLKMAMPILSIFLLLMVILAVMARVSPETNILFLSLPLRVGLGLLLIGFFIPFMLSFLKQFAGLLDKLLPI